MWIIRHFYDLSIVWLFGQWLVRIFHSCFKLEHRRLNTEHSTRFEFLFISLDSWTSDESTKLFSVHRIITFSYVYRLLSFILLSRNLCEQWKSLMACWLDVRLCVSWSLFSLQILFLSIGHIAAETYVHMKFPKDRSTSIIIARSSLNF